jgi:hypothetical protein
MNRLSKFASPARKLFRALGFDVMRYPAALPPDTPAEIREICRKVAPYTMTSPQRVHALCEGVRYIHANRIEGAIVECGVWKGGSMMAVAETLVGLGDSYRQLFLFDTFEGMTQPSEHDVDFSGETASELLNRSSKDDAQSVWCVASTDAVRGTLASTGYPAENIHLVKGMVESTIPDAAPERIALLRLDTDWYESTRHELQHLFPRLAIGGVLIIDDYGHWEGARKAVDDYIRENRVRLLLHRIDYSGRIAVKTA